MFSIIELKIYNNGLMPSLLYVKQFKTNYSS